MLDDPTFRATEANIMMFINYTVCRGKSIIEPFSFDMVNSND